MILRYNLLIVGSAMHGKYVVPLLNQSSMEVEIEIYSEYI